jgi:hypothetical protein
MGLAGMQRAKGKERDLFDRYSATSDCSCTYRSTYQHDWVVYILPSTNRGIAEDIFASNQGYC